MSEGHQSDTNPSPDQLAGLLDEALGEFGKHKSERASQPSQRVDDDDLDDFLAPMDAEATKKAALAFEKMLKEFAEPAAFSASPAGSAAAQSDGTHFLSELLGINRLLDEEGADPEIRALTETLLKGCFTKEVIHPLVQQFHKAIQEYLDDAQVQFTDEERNNLNGQKEVFAQLIAAYDEQSEPATAEQVDAQNQLWAKLRDLGEVPPALIEKFEAQMPQGPGLPGLGAGAEQCSIM